MNIVLEAKDTWLVAIYTITPFASRILHGLVAQRRSKALLTPRLRYRNSPNPPTHLQGEIPECQ